MKNQLPDITEVDVKGKRVFLRSDLDAPIQFKVQSSKFKVEDDTRLAASMPTLEYLLEKGASVILAGHLRRPEGYDPKLSLLPIAKWLASRLGTNPVIPAKAGIQDILGSPIPPRGLAISWRRRSGMTKTQIGDDKKENLGGFDGWRLSDQLFLLENLRFDQGEKKNDPELAKQLASLADIYVNDAFASSHREHASIVGIPSFLPHFAGLRLQKEIEVLSGILENPKRALVVIIGGAKIETKLPLVEKMHKFADYVLIGGKIAIESEELLKVQHENVNFKNGGRKSLLFVSELNEEKTDITLGSAENFLQIISIAETIIWNGPLGIVEQEENGGLRGSKMIAEAIIKSKAFSVVGGGDTLEFLKKLGILKKFSFFSTGGGAMLALLSGEKLPGIEALKR